MSRATIEAKLRAKLDRHVAKKAQELRNIIVETLGQPGSGRAYSKTRTVRARDERGRFTGGSATSTVTHIASAPGEPPAADTGRLRQSIRAQKREELVYAVGTNVEYAVPLEFGTRKIAPRPFMRPSVEVFKRRL